MSVRKRDLVACTKGDGRTKRVSIEFNQRRKDQTKRKDRCVCEKQGARKHQKGHSKGIICNIYDMKAQSVNETNAEKNIKSYLLHRSPPKTTCEHHCHGCQETQNAVQPVK